MNRSMKLLLAGLVSVAACAAAASADAQCCGVPTVAVAQPVMVAQPQVVAFQQARVGLFDRWRMRRWGVTPVQPVMAAMPVQQSVAFAPSVQTVGFAPSVQTVGFAPTVQTVGFAPAAPVVQTVGWRPHVAAFAPLGTTTFVTAARPVVMSPVVSSCSACEPCACAQPACPACDAGVSQATFVAPAPAASSCPTCAAAASTPVYSSVPSVGPATPQPTLAPNEGAPANSEYDANKLQLEQKPVDPAPVPNPESDSSTYFEAPKLFNPQDRTASKPSVEVHNAVYHQATTYRGVSQTSAPETDANGWYAVPSSR